MIRFYFTLILLTSIIDVYSQIDSSDYYLNKGLKYYEKQEFTKAISAYTKGLNFDKKNVSIYVNRAYSRLQLKDLDGLFSDATKALELDNKISHAYFLRASYYSIKMENFDKALSDYNMAIYLNDNVANYYFSRGLLFLLYKNIDLACSDFKTANNLGFSKAIEKIELYCPDGFYYKGNQSMSSKDYQEAIDYYTKSIELFPANDLAYNERGIAKCRLKEYYNAIVDFTKAIELKPSSNAYFTRGYTKADVKDYIGAKADLSKAIEMDSKNVGAYFFRGFVKGALKDHKGAILDLTKVIQMNPNNGEAYLYRGTNKLQINDKEGGCLDFSRAGELGEKLAFDLINENCQ